MLIIRLLLHPTSRASPQNEFTDFIINKDEQAVGDGTEPPKNLQGVHAQGHVHSRAVREEGSQGRLYKQAKDQDPVLHALLKEGIPPGFADDQISPLDDHNAGKEGCVAGEFNYLPLFIGPLLPKAVLQVIEFTVIPVDADAHQVSGAEAVFSQNHKVGEKSRESLDHTYLSISHTDEAFIDQLVCFWISWLPFHDVTLSHLISQRDGRNHVSAQVDAEDGDSSQRKRNTSKDEHEEG